ncbi:glycosyltransferase family 2 protein [bacterium]|nr:glycosyltransferase family 2 protein [bacterium]
MDRIPVVIVNWNAGQALRNCLESLSGCHPGLDLDVVLVDNASIDSSVETAQPILPGLRVIRNPDNRGFAAAVNQGLAQTDRSSPFVLLLNPDARFSADTLGPLLAFLAEHPEAAAVGPMILGSDNRLQRGCRRREPSAWGMLCRSLALDMLFPSSRLFAGHIYGQVPAERTIEVDSLSGSFMLIRRAALETVGGLDERFFMYAEDLDWCRRAREGGWKLYYHPAVRVQHLRAVSSSQRPLGRLWDLNFTACQYIRKHHGGLREAPARVVLYLALGLRFMLGLPVALSRALGAAFRKTKV